MKYYKFNYAEKEKYLKAWTNAQPAYKVRKAIAAILYVVAAAILVVCAAGIPLMSGEGASEGKGFLFVIGLLTGLALGCIPFFIGRGLVNSGKNEYGRPYCRMTKEFLAIDDKVLQFGYNNTQDPNTQSMDVYEIPLVNINRVTFDPQYCMLTIFGRGALTVYDDYAAGVINPAKSQRTFLDNSPYSFILTCQERDEVIRLLKSKQKWED